MAVNGIISHLAIVIINIIIAAILMILGMIFFAYIILKIFKLTFVEFKIYPSHKEEKLTLPKIKFFYKNKDLSKILDFRKEQEIGNLIKLINQSEAIDSLFNQFNIKLVITNVTRGIHGYYVEKAKKKNIPAIFFSTHLANWELGPMTAYKNNIPVLSIFRKPNNPLVRSLKGVFEKSTLD